MNKIEDMLISKCIPHVIMFEFDKGMRSRVHRNWEGLTMLAKINIWTVRMKALKADPDNVVMTDITNSGVDSGELFYLRRHDIFSPRHLNERVVRVVFRGDGEARGTGIEVRAAGALISVAKDS